jgi:hypothetical protein
VHGPAVTVVTTEPATVQTGVVSELNDTGSPDDACADRVTGAPTFASGGRPNVIVCAADPALTGLTWNDRVTGKAARGGAPSWKAVIVHVPTAAVVTVEPATVHTGVVPELNNSGSPGGGYYSVMKSEARARRVILAEGEGLLAAAQPLSKAGAPQPPARWRRSRR